ncbi:MAG: ABC transporter ATP-binding protein [Candidatus Cohnella colombiensis]|uniref:ABC transporter ATP-binding protein n=1 Tax=Candidatus Cohnella colombiensis TaxID=3121368 RepID=A0AA95EXX1_9BACL|nr:MAG: ABC transporter ATP-binding protein [Cohnella sp.]
MTLVDTDHAIVLKGAEHHQSPFTLGPLNCEIPRGYVTAIVGRNGSGKSTLFRMLLGLAPVNGGTIEVLGTLLGPQSDEAYKAKVGFLPENPFAYENSITANEKAAFASKWYPTWDWERYYKIMRHFDGEGTKKLSKLSKGMRRKVELAVTLAHDPELLLLDEPSTGLDPFAWKSMIEQLQRYMENGDRTLVIASHITEEVRRLADYILFMYRGSILGIYEKDKLFDDWRVLVVQWQGESIPDRGKLGGIPGVQGITEAGPGIFRIEVNEPASGEQYCQAIGFHVLSVQRMELEDILGCLIRKEDAKR